MFAVRVRHFYESDDNGMVLVVRNARYPEKDNLAMFKHEYLARKEFLRGWWPHDVMVPYTAVERELKDYGWEIEVIKGEIPTAFL